MKKIATILMLFVVIGLIVSCGKKITPEEEVRNYGKYFVEKVNANQLDSLKLTYPDIVKADSIMPIKSDTIIVAEIAPGQYDMMLAEGITLKVSRSDDGHISVIESKGLFAFPIDKVNIAKKTGMVRESMNDKEIIEIIEDSDYFEWLKNKYLSMVGYVIKVTPGKMNIVSVPNAEAIIGKMNLTINNLSDRQVSGEAYNIFYKSYECDGGSDDSAETFTITRKLNGIDLGPNENRIIKVSIPEAMKFYDFKIKPVDGKEELIKYQYEPTGKEYQEYLDSKK
ncbi:MAG: hypothetical protein J1E95_02380 [Muribaculaceae bacterium]|nr:hypothetical protein [Muribaculaceae bacterium]